MRRTLAVAAVLALGATGAALPANAAVSDVPADCSTFTTAYHPDGRRVSYGYAAGKTSVTSYPGDTLAWVPSAWQQIGAAGDPYVFMSSEIATHPTDGYLYDIQRRGEQVDGVWRMTENTATRMAPGFADTRILVDGVDYLYRVAGSSLYRYTRSYTNGRYTVSAPLTLRTTGWDQVKTLTYARTEGTGGAAVDVLLGTKTNGALAEWRVNQATPTTIGSTTLRSSGWSGFGSVSTGWCEEHPAGRVLLGITPAGSASVHFDADQRDRIGSDIKGGSLGALGWTAKGYGQ